MCVCSQRCVLEKRGKNIHYCVSATVCYQEIYTNHVNLGVCVCVYDKVFAPSLYEGWWCHLISLHYALLCRSQPFPNHLDLLEVMWARDLPPDCKSSFDITAMDWSGKNIRHHVEVGHFRNTLIEGRTWRRREKARGRCKLRFASAFYKCRDKSESQQDCFVLRSTSHPDTLDSKQHRGLLEIRPAMQSST